MSCVCSQSCTSYRTAFKLASGQSTIVILLYGGVWLVSSRFRLAALLSSHDVAGMSGLQWVQTHPWLAVAGVFFSFKVLWLLPGMAIVKGRANARDLQFMILCIGGGILLAAAGVDTSRMVGFAFPAFLVALACITKSGAEGQSDRPLAMVFLINLLIPSFAVGLNTGLSLGPGVYRALWTIMFQ